MLRVSFSIVVIAASLAAAQSLAAEPKLPLKQGDQIVILGNTFAERLAESGYFETLLLGKYPQHRLAVWNLGWSGDTPTQQPRPLNFGPLKQHLTERKADVILLCFGMNESFAGEAGREAFKQSLQAFVRSLAESKFNGSSAPRLALVSPIAHEQLAGDLPDAAPHNRQLAAYSATMQEVAAAERIAYVDLFTPTQTLMQAEETPLTTNGIHLTPYGYWLVAQLMFEDLGYGATVKQAEYKVPDDGDVRRGLALPAFEIKAIVPPPPEGVRPGQRVSTLLPTLRIAGLPPGRYRLHIEDVPSVTATAEAWARGVPVASGPAEVLRKAVIDKNEEFFYRWRALNGEYIYGRRAKPFGVVSFPPEIKRMDALIAERQRSVWRNAESRAGQAMRLAPAPSE